MLKEKKEVEKEEDVKEKKREGVDRGREEKERLGEGVEYERKRQERKKYIKKGNVVTSHSHDITKR